MQIVYKELSKIKNGLTVKNFNWENILTDSSLERPMNSKWTPEQMLKILSH